MKHIIIIGSGFGGLSAAALLAKKGFKVTVFEKNNQPGGRAMVWKSKDFTFDMGPSFYQMPEVFDNFFRKFNKKTSDFYKLIRLNPSYRMIFGENDVIDVSSDLKQNYQLFEKLETGAGKKLKEYLKQAEYQYTISMEEFMYKEYRSLLDYFSPRLLSVGSKLHVFESMDRYVNRYFKNDRLKKILQYTLVFLGGSPKKTPAIYSLMAHVDFNLGVWYPMGGMGKVAQGLYQNAINQGVKFKFNCEVTRIEVEKGKAIGVVVKKQFHSADYVLANADYHHVETKLLKKEFQSKNASYWNKVTLAPSAFIIYLGLNKRIKNLSHHNFVLVEDWIKHFDQIFEKPEWPKKPSYYISCPSISDASVAPKGGENLFILVPVASGLKDTPKIRKQFYNKIITDLEANLDVEFQKNIVTKRIFAHRDFEAVFNAYKGTALGMAHTLFQTAYFRPSPRSRKVKNLFFTGQYTHPGIGMPIQLISGEIVADLIAKEDAT